MRRIAQPCAAKVKIASRSFTWSMLAIVAAHTPGLPGQCAALSHPSKWYILKPFISFPGGTLSLTADRLGCRTLGERAGKEVCGDVHNEAHYDNYNQQIASFGTSVDFFRLPTNGKPQL